MTSLNLISHVCKTRKFVMAISHWNKSCYVINGNIMTYAFTHVVLNTILTRFFGQSRSSFDSSVTGDHSFKHSFIPGQIQYRPTTAFRRILFNPVVIILAFRPGVLDSNPARSLYLLCICLFVLCYVLRS